MTNSKAHPYFKSGEQKYVKIFPITIQIIHGSHSCMTF